MFYNARDMAVVRAHIGGFPAILASATPSIESRVNAESGKYNDIRLPERFGGAALPDLSLIDMRRHPPERGGFLSPVLLDAVGKTIEGGRTVPAVSQPARLCAADPVPGLRPPVRMSRLFELAGRAPFPQPASVPPLRPYGADTRCLSGMRNARSPGGLRAGRRAHCRRGRPAFSRRPHHPVVVGHARRGEKAAARTGGDRKGRGRHRHRHANSSPRGTIFR